jgi:acyl-CoA synthetase (AMP-forming)/AMP-acid ligase II
MIVTGGQNVYAAEVEDIIMRFPGVADCAVVGLPDETWGERVTSIVVPRPGIDLKPAELDAFCRRHLAGFKIPKEFIFDNREPAANADRQGAEIPGDRAPQGQAWPAEFAGTGITRPGPPRSLRGSLSAA